jgi:hypothetical protein
MKRVTSHKDKGRAQPKSTDSALQAPQAKAPAAGASPRPAAPPSPKLGSVARSAGVGSPKVSKAPSVLSPPSGPPKAEGEHPSSGDASRVQSGSSPRGSSPADEDPRFQGE